MRRAARIDDNQPDIVAALRAVGASVQSLAALGKGVPDLLVFFRGRLFLLEVKNPLQSRSDQQLTPDEAAWHAAWGGPVYVVRTIDEALVVIGAVEATR